MHFELESAEQSEEAEEEFEDELSVLEAGLLKSPSDNEIKKQLMVKYNQAIKVYSGSETYRHRVDGLLLKVDELRNTIRKNI
ncbi:hypothetical protein [Erwinia sp. V71]|uniref:hypothetical protein n=1 Tax=Erwinia sp. V71 TaxID=3369424 RepID=UPI003F5EF8F6